MGFAGVGPLAFFKSGESWLDVCAHLCRPSRARGFLYVGHPALTRWAKLCRAYGAGVAARLRPSPGLRRGKREKAASRRRTPNGREVPRCARDDALKRQSGENKAAERCLPPSPRLRRGKQGKGGRGYIGQHHLPGVRFRG